MACPRRDNGSGTCVGYPRTLRTRSGAREAGDSAVLCVADGTVETVVAVDQNHPNERKKGLEAQARVTVRYERHSGARALRLVGTSPAGFEPRNGPQGRWISIQSLTGGLSLRLRCIFKKSTGNLRYSTGSARDNARL